MAENCSILTEDDEALLTEGGARLLVQNCTETSNLIINGWYVDARGGMHYSYRERN